MLILKDASGEVEDRVQYSDNTPWPVAADGMGPSLQLISTDLDNNDPANWYTSSVSLFSPGSHNADNYTSEDHHAHQLSVKIYPNPVRETIFIDVTDQVESEIQVQIFTLTGIHVASSVFKAVNYHGKISWKHGITKPGAYILKIISNHPEGKINMAQLMVIL